MYSFQNATNEMKTWLPNDLIFMKIRGDYLNFDFFRITTGETQS
jgi:hypothetical protein